MERKAAVVLPGRGTVIGELASGLVMLFLLALLIWYR